jgi:hypothetical protein
MSHTYIVLDDSDLKISKRLDPETFRVNVCLTTQKGQMLNVNLTYEQMRTLTASLLDISEEAVNGLWN